MQPTSGHSAAEHPTKIGKYVVDQFLGGGMSHVYRATDTVLGRRVAVKVLTEAAMADPEAKARFLQEARLASNIQHENIIAIYDFGEDAGRPFMVMEFVEGESLRAAIEHGRAGDIGERIRIARQAAKALEHIHQRKVIHRDIKPENIHIDRMGKVRLMDFGIAGNTGVQAAEGATAGTPYYMAPEQVLNQPLTAQADIYAFGVVLYELFTGKKPFNADTVEKIFEQILYQPVDPQPLVAAGVPKTIIDTIQRCTSKRLMERPQSMTAVVDALQIAARHDPAPAPPPPTVTPGLLSPSAQRPESEVRLRMPPPPSSSEAGKGKKPVETAPPQNNSVRILLLAALGAVVVIVVISLFNTFTGK